MKITAIADKDFGRVWGAVLETGAEDALAVERVVASAGFLVRMATADKKVLALPISGLQVAKTENADVLRSPRDFALVDGVLVSQTTALTVKLSEQGITITELTDTSVKYRVKGYLARDDDPGQVETLDVAPLDGAAGGAIYKKGLTKNQDYRFVIMVDTLGFSVGVLKAT
jgi:hypothetical protein